jgi:two-component system sensor histidine kinase BaeS
MKSRIIWKLLGINILTIGVVIVIVWLAVNNLAAGYFTVLMEKYHISPTSSHEMFVSAIHRYLIWASIGAIVLAAVLSFLMMKRILKPLMQMTSITQNIASGNYSAGIPVETQDEVGQLATAFNHMSESLQQIEELRKTMMIDIAHELRTPLTNINGYLEALIDGVVTPNPETFELLQAETHRLIRLVEDILRLAKADAAVPGLNKQEISLAKLLDDIIETFMAPLRQKRITVHKNYQNRDLTVLADRDQLFQIVQNLMENCRQYTPDGGEITVSMEKTPKGVKVAFSNPSGDISDKNLPFIFERFFRGEKSRSREHGGAGIGLAIVKELVAAHGGSVEAGLENGQIRIAFELPMDDL